MQTGKSYGSAGMVDGVGRLQVDNGHRVGGVGLIWLTHRTATDDHYSLVLGRRKDDAG